MSPRSLAKGAIFDVLRTGLYDTTRVKPFDAAGDRVLEALRRTGQSARADHLEDMGRDRWSARKMRELDAADELMVRRYATAIAYARRYEIKTPAISRAVARLGFFTNLISDAKMRTLVERTPDPFGAPGTLVYAPEMYVKGRSGLEVSRPPLGVSPPSPLNENAASGH